MNETPTHIESGVETHQEGNPNVEQAEQKIFGKNYQQVEIVHKFADDHAWFHPALIVFALAIIVGIVWVARRVRKNKTI